MAALVGLTASPLPVAVGLGFVTYGLTLALTWRAVPALLRDLTGDSRYADNREREG
jgi:hypothetical protein